MVAFNAYKVNVVRKKIYKVLDFKNHMLVNSETKKNDLTVKSDQHIKTNLLYRQKPNVKWKCFKLLINLTNFVNFLKTQ